MTHDDITEALSTSNGHIRNAARSLGVPVRTLYYQCRKNGVNPDDYRPEGYKQEGKNGCCQRKEGKTVVEKTVVAKTVPVKRVDPAREAELSPCAGEFCNGCPICQPEKTVEKTVIERE